MPYGVVAPGIRMVYTRWSDVERIRMLYPYPKFRKFKTEEECWEFVHRYGYNREFTDIHKYGDTFDKLFLRMEYYIYGDCVYYNFFTGKLGYVKIISADENVIVQSTTSVIKACMRNIELDDDRILSHLIAIYHGLKLVGDYVDVDVRVPDHSIYYALCAYRGNNNTFNRALESIRNRLGEFSVSLEYSGEEEV